MKGIRVQILICLYVFSVETSKTLGMRKCEAVQEYYEEATDSCAQCSQLCHEHGLQGTTERCKRECAKYLEAASTPSTTSTTPPPPKTPPPTQTSTQSSDSWNGEIRIVCIVVVPTAAAIFIILLFVFRRKLKCCKRCPPAPKPPDVAANPPQPPQQCSPTQAVQPQSDPRERGAFCQNSLQSIPGISADEVQSQPPSAEDGVGETTMLLEDTPARASFHEEDETR